MTGHQQRQHATWQRLLELADYIETIPLTRYGIQRWVDPELDTVNLLGAAATLFATEGLNVDPTYFVPLYSDDSAVYKGWDAGEIFFGIKLIPVSMEKDPKRVAIWLRERVLELWKREFDVT